MRQNPKKKGIACKSRKIYGSYPVQEHLRGLQNDVQEVYLLPSLKGTPVEELARQKKVPLHYKSRSFFEVFAQGGIHQGVAACLLPFPYVPLQSVMEKNADLLLILR